MARNVLKNHVVESKTVTMSASAQAQSEVQLPSFNADIAAFELNISVTGAGTLANSIDNAISALVVKDKGGNQLLQGCSGSDLTILERMRNIGNSRTPATATTSAQAFSFYIPLNIEKKDQEAKAQVSVAAYTALGASATGGSVTYTLTAWYYDVTVGSATEKIQKITQPIGSGLNTLGLYLPKNVVITNLFFTVGTETNITSIRFTGDGTKEYDGITPSMLSGIDAARKTGGHVTGQFDLYMSPFYCDSKTSFDVTGAGSDTVNIYAISEYVAA